jgi:hypothetical protein
MHKPDPEERRVLFLEFVAAGAIFLVIGIVLYMVFMYRPV